MRIREGVSDTTRLFFFTSLLPPHLTCVTSFILPVAVMKYVVLFTFCLWIAAVHCQMPEEEEVDQFIEALCSK